MRISRSIRMFFAVAGTVTLGVADASAQTNGAKEHVVVESAVLGVDASQRDPRKAFLAGLVVPGLGQVYNGQRALGAAVFGVAATSLVAGAMSTRTRVYCAAPLDSSACPPAYIHSTTVEHHRMGRAILGAVAVTAAGAVYAYVTTGRSNTTPIASESAATGGTTVSGPQVLGWEGDRLSLSFIRLAF